MRLAVCTACCLLPLLLMLAPAAALGQSQAPEIDQPLRNLASKLSEAVAKAGIKNLGVPQFANSMGEIGWPDGKLGDYAASKIQEALMVAAQDRFGIISRQRLQQVLLEQKIEASGLTEPSSIQKLGQIENLDALVAGQVLPAPGMRVHVSAELVELPTAKVLAHESCDITWDTDAQALSGRTDGISTDLCQMDLLVDGRPRRVYTHGSFSYVAAEVGKEYSVRLYNGYGKRVGVALLVDGLNTITKKMSAPSEGPMWILEPGQEWEISGYREGDAHARRFRFVVAEESLAKCVYFTDQIGLITASFYPEADAAKGGPGEVGTVPGTMVNFPTRKADLVISRRAAAVLSLRYDRPEFIPGFQPETEPGRADTNGGAIGRAP